MLRAEVAVAKTAVANDSLGGRLALLESASGLLRRHGDSWFSERSNLLFLVGKDGRILRPQELCSYGISMSRR